MSESEKQQAWEPGDYGLVDVTEPPRRCWQQPAPPCSDAAGAAPSRDPRTAAAVIGAALRKPTQNGFHQQLNQRARQAAGALATERSMQPRSPRLGQKPAATTAAPLRRQVIVQTRSAPQQNESTNNEFSAMNRTDSASSAAFGSEFAAPI